MRAVCQWAGMVVMAGVVIWLCTRAPTVADAGDPLTCDRALQNISATSSEPVVLASGNVTASACRTDTSASQGPANEVACLLTGAQSNVPNCSDCCSLGCRQCNPNCTSSGCRYCCI